MGRAPDIIANLKDKGVRFDGEGSEEEQAWTWLCLSRAQFVAEGRMTNTCRLFGLVASIVKHVDDWFIDLREGVRRH